MPLSDTACRNAKALAKPFKLTDEKGLYLLVNPNRSKWWRFKFRYGGKEQLLSLGVYPDVPLKAARDARDEARRLLAAGINPSLHRQLEKQRKSDAAANSFEAVAREWFAKHSPRWAQGHSEKIIRRLERDVFPWLGQRPISEITPRELLVVIRRVEQRGKLETAHRALQNCSQVFRYGVASGHVERDPTSDLRGAIPPPTRKHMATMTEPSKIGALLRAIDDYDGSFVTKCALQLAPLWFVRPGELRKAEWSEINFDSKEWRIPATRMKMKEQHIVPLSKQAIAILEELQPLTGRSQLLFPSLRSPRKPMSENTLNAALRRMGYSKEEMTAHGFRSMASTLLNEQGFNRDWIERQLAHAERNEIRAAYNYAEHLPERKRMMQTWANHLDALRRDKKVVALKRAG